MTARPSRSLQEKVKKTEAPTPQPEEEIAPPVVTIAPIEIPSLPEPVETLVSDELASTPEPISFDPVTPEHVQSQEKPNECHASDIIPDIQQEESSSPMGVENRLKHLTWTIPRRVSKRVELPPAALFSPKRSLKGQLLERLLDDLLDGKVAQSQAREAVHEYVAQVMAEAREEESASCAQVLRGMAATAKWKSSIMLQNAAVLLEDRHKQHHSLGVFVA